MQIKDLVKESHKTAKEKGFWESKNIPEKIMLVVTELAEAVEALRHGRMQITSYNKIGSRGWEKDTFEDEICDAFIRLADLCGYIGIDIEWQLKQKMEYNKKRAFKHGKKF